MGAPQNLKRLARVGTHDSGLASGSWELSENNGEPFRGIKAVTRSEMCSVKSLRLQWEEEKFQVGRRKIPKGRTFGRESSQAGSKEKKQRTVWRYGRH